MRRMLALLLAAAVLAVAPTAQAQQFFDFNGQTLLPASVGGTLTMYSIINNNNQVDTPIPLDFANYEYTLVVTNLVFMSDGPTQQYDNGTITIYQDNATAADYTNPATFVDGVAILSGALYSVGRTMFTANLGSVSGLVDWTGGTRLAELGPGERLGWAFLSSISNRSTVTLPGYDENWDGKCEPQTPIADSQQSFGQLKGGYNR